MVINDEWGKKFEMVKEEIKNEFIKKFKQS